MIKPDIISNFLSILAVLFAVYLSTFEMQLPVLFPAILLVSGMVMQVYLLHKFEAPHPAEEITYSRIFLGITEALVTMTLAGLFLPMIFTVKFYTGMSISPSHIYLHMIFMAIAEEQFFRGAVANFIYTITKTTTISCLVSSAIFTGYHFAVYGLAFDAFAYIFIVGTVLAFVGFQSGRLSTPMIAHILNNIFASGILRVVRW